MFLYLHLPVALWYGSVGSYYTHTNIYTVYVCVY